MTLEIWPLPKKIVKITKKCGIASFHSAGTCWLRFKKKVIGWFPHKKKTLIISFHTAFSQGCYRWQGRSACNITGLRGQPKLTPSHLNSTGVLPISNPDLPHSSDADPDPDEEEWCPNLQFDSGKPKWTVGSEDDIDGKDKQNILA